MFNHIIASIALDSNTANALGLGILNTVTESNGRPENATDCDASQVPLIFSQTQQPSIRRVSQALKPYINMSSNNPPSSYITASGDRQWTLDSFGTVNRGGGTKALSEEAPELTGLPYAIAERPLRYSSKTNAPTTRLVHLIVNPLQCGECRLCHTMAAHGLGAVRLTERASGPMCQRCGGSSGKNGRIGASCCCSTAFTPRTLR